MPVEAPSTLVLITILYSGVKVEIRLDLLKIRVVYWISNLFFEVIRNDLMRVRILRIEVAFYDALMVFAGLY